MGPSTHNLAALPDPGKLKALCQSLAMLDAVISPQWESRYYSFNHQWDDDIALASMRNGAGDDYFILFVSAEVVIKGFAHESEMSPYRVQPPLTWPGILDALPEALKAPLSDPAFSLEDVTFCIWNTGQDSRWEKGDISFPDTEFSDGSEDLLDMLDGNPQTFQNYVEEYYEREISLDAIKYIYKHQPLTNSILTTINPEASWEDLEEDIAEIGYPNKLR